MLWERDAVVEVRRRVYDAGMRLRAEAAARSIEPDFALALLSRDESRRRGDAVAASFWHRVFEFMYESGYCVAAGTPVVITGEEQRELFPEADSR